MNWTQNQHLISVQLVCFSEISLIVFGDISKILTFFQIQPVTSYFLHRFQHLNFFVISFCKLFVIMFCCSSNDNQNRNQRKSSQNRGKLKNWLIINAVNWFFEVLINPPRTVTAVHASKSELTVLLGVAAELTHEQVAGLEDGDGGRQHWLVTVLLAQQEHLVLPLDRAVLRHHLQPQCTPRWQLRWSGVDYSRTGLKTKSIIAEKDRILNFNWPKKLMHTDPFTISSVCNPVRPKLWLP